ncbi:MAG: gamma-glutamyltransferase [Phycisphaerales bacterium]|nr:MAG: gamma-glutamyltransferase [Phycisphaerales bacterium]
MMRSPSESNSSADWPCARSHRRDARQRVFRILEVTRHSGELHMRESISAATFAFVAVAFTALCGCQIQPADRAIHGPAAQYTTAAIATDHPLASEAGAAMLARGGNAVDAAVAASFTLSVVRPYSCGIGGGGFMVIHLPPDEPERDSRQIVINYRETAPAAVNGDYYVELDDPEASRFGVHAVGVPGTVAGLLHALEHHGTLDRATVLAPAIRAARNGYRADAHHIWAMNHLRDLLDERSERGEHFTPLWHQLFAAGNLEEGDLVRNGPKAAALQLIAHHGAEAFYEGPIADAIGGVIRANGGAISADDLRSYEPEVIEPLRGRFGEYELISMPPPSSGGVALQQIFGIIERHLDTTTFADPDDPAYIHLAAEAMKHAFADRAEWLADVNFVDVPIDRLTSSEYLDELAARFDPEAVLDDLYAYGSVTPANAQNAAGGGTSHLSVIDADGMAVACTETINLICGSLVSVPGFGFALNNEMDDFTTIPGEPNAFGLRQSDRNLPEPGKRPLSSMSPTIVLRDDRAVLVAGASGGPRIITGTAQAILNVLHFGNSAEDAVLRPRFHHQWMPNELMLEPDWDAPELIRALEARGHAFGEIHEVGVVQLIHRRPDGTLEAVSDPRKGGRPSGVGAVTADQ